MSSEVYSGLAVRRAIWHFLSGKAVSALLTLVIMLWLVRLLPIAEYGTYVVLTAGTELGFALGSIGLPWLAARYIPEYRLHANGQTLARLCRQLIFWQATALIVLATVAVFGLDAYLRWTDLVNYRMAAWLALALLAAEGLGRFLRDGLMPPLMLQGQARISLILRQLMFLVAIATLASAGQAELILVLAAEVTASLFGWIIASIATMRYLRSLEAQAGEPDWLEPGFAKLWRVALPMYTSYLITLTYSPQVFINLIQRSLGAEAAALFGFLRMIYQQISRYLPATLLFTVLRPKLIASYLQGGMKTFTRKVNLVGKSSLFVLFPIIVLVALGGDSLVALLSGHRFETGGHYLLVLLLSMVPVSQRQLIEMVAVTVGRAGLCTFGSVLSFIALPFMLYLLDLGLGLWSPVLAILFGQAIFNLAVLIGLTSVGYRTDWLGAIKLAASAFLAWFLANVAMPDERNIICILLFSLLVGLVFIVSAWWLQVFTTEDRQRLDSVIGRRLFAR